MAIILGDSVTIRSRARRVAVVMTVAVAIVVVVSSSSAETNARGQAASEVERGQDLYLESCSSCHGADGDGTDFGPSIENAGAAAADFQLRTGRMPLANSENQAVRKPPAFSPQEIEQIVAFVRTLGDGPAIPEVDPQARSLATGQDLFVTNCAPCHGATGTGGAVGQGALAPPLLASEPIDVAEAMITGPGQMPVFGFSKFEQDAIVAFVEHIKDSPDPGGADIGGIGPVPEGYLAWGLGAVLVVLVCVFIGRKQNEDEQAGT